jgi:hypothetical protein
LTNEHIGAIILIERGRELTTMATNIKERIEVIERELYLMEYIDRWRAADYAREAELKKELRELKKMLDK